MQQDFKDKVKELGSNILNLTDENEVRRNSNLLNKKIFSLIFNFLIIFLIIFIYFSFF